MRRVGQSKWGKFSLSKVYRLGEKQHIRFCAPQRERKGAIGKKNGPGESRAVKSGKATFSDSSGTFVG